MRPKTIGGSDAAVVLGLSSKKDRDILWLEKKGLIAEEDLSDVGDVQRGKELEEKAFRKYCAKMNYEEKYFIEFKQDDPLLVEGYPFAHATPDRLGSRTDLNHVVEIKCPRSSTLREWLRSSPPVEYYIQCQHYMMVTNASFAHLVALDYDNWDVQVWTWERDEELIEILKREEKRFFDSLDGSYCCLLEDVDVKMPAPKESETTVKVENEKLAQTLMRYNEFSKIEKEAKEGKEVAKAEIKQTLLELNESKVSCGGYKASFTQYEKEGLDMVALARSSLNLDPFRRNSIVTKITVSKEKEGK